jgi:hypothetical protein
MDDLSIPEAKVPAVLDVWYRILPQHPLPPPERVPRFPEGSVPSHFAPVC